MANPVNLPEVEKPGSLIAPIFSEGMVVSASDLNSITQYTIDLQCAVNRAAIGFGVVEGFAISQESDVTTISSGLAIDISGYPIVLEKNCEINLSGAESSHNQSVLMVERLSNEEENVEPDALPTGISNQARDVVRFCFIDAASFDNRSEGDHGVAIARLTVDDDNNATLALDPEARDIAKIAM